MPIPHDPIGDAVRDTLANPPPPKPEDVMDAPARDFFAELIGQMIGNNAQEATLYVDLNGARIGFTISIDGVKMPKVEPPSTPVDLTGTPADLTGAPADPTGAPADPTGAPTPDGAPL